MIDIICPGCRKQAPEHTYPSKSKHALKDGELWWCRDCLAGKVVAAHADDCRCEGCR